MAMPLAAGRHPGTRMPRRAWGRLKPQALQARGRSPVAPPSPPSLMAAPPHPLVWRLQLSACSRANGRRRWFRHRGRPHSLCRRGPAIAPSSRRVLRRHLLCDMTPPLSLPRRRGSRSRTQLLVSPRPFEKERLGTSMNSVAQFDLKNQREMRRIQYALARICTEPAPSASTSTRTGSRTSWALVSRRLMVAQFSRRPKSSRRFSRRSLMTRCRRPRCSSGSKRSHGALAQEPRSCRRKHPPHSPPTRP
jgi:hypothetical protein